MVGTIVAATSCRASYPVRQPLGAGPRDLIVRFAQPQGLEARTIAGAPQHLLDISAVRGKAMRVRNDTVEFRVERTHGTPRLQQPTTWHRLSEPLILMLPLHDRSVRVEEERLSPGRTMATVLLGAPATAYLVAIMLGAWDDR
jgi:hypothetical protein